MNYWNLIFLPVLIIGILLLLLSISFFIFFLELLVFLELAPLDFVFFYSINIAKIFFWIIINFIFTFIRVI